MPARKDQQTDVRTRLGSERVRAGLSQREMAERIGIGPATYRRLERGQMENPPLRYLVNAAIVLKVPVEKLIDEAWRGWLDLGRDAPSTPGA